METFLDNLLAFLVAQLASVLPSTAGFILGDPGTSAPTSLPFLYLVPLWDAVKPYSAGVDMDTYVAPILIVDDMHAYGPPIANVNVSGAKEQPGYRKLMQYAQAARAALRAHGAAITQSGTVATSNVSSISYVWVQVDQKSYRGARLAFTVQQRRAQT